MNTLQLLLLKKHLPYSLLPQEENHVTTPCYYQPFLLCKVLILKKKKKKKIQKNFRTLLRYFIIIYFPLSLPPPFFISRPVSVYVSRLVKELEEPHTPFLLNPLEQWQCALLKGRSRVRLERWRTGAQSLWPLWLVCSHELFVMWSLICVWR